METRGIITIEGKAVVLPDAEVWMTTGEIASLFYVRGVTVEAAIRKLRKDGILADIAPTLLQVMGLDIPKEMTGKSLIK